MKSYEQRYKAALEWMQGLYSGLHGATKEEAEKYFPELKENKSERVRKGLIKTVSSLLDNTILYHTDITKEEALAWLEKQEETFNADMTREDEIKEARHEWYLRTQDADFCAGFQKGAEWADAHPDIDVRTMAAWQSGYKEAIEKACEWLDCYIDNYLFIDAENKAGIKWDEFINDFRKAMKGGEK